MSDFFEMGDKGTEKQFNTFYTEDTPLDAIFVGTSHVFYFWQAPLAWNEYGITVLDVASGSVPASAIKYRIEECLKYQDPKLIIIDTTSFYSAEREPIHMHGASDFMKPSLTKYKSIAAICKEAELSWEDSLEYYMPFIRFHSRWEELTRADFEYQLSEYKNGFEPEPFFTTVTDIVSTAETFSNTRTPIPEINEELLRDLLEYCKGISTEILFISEPVISQVIATEWNNYIGDIVTSEGFNYLDFCSQEQFGAVGYEIPADWLDGGHVNIHGSEKFTHYVGQYLVDNYGFIDKRGGVEYIPWNKAYQAYQALIDKYTE
jgi:hypothetical protein